MTSYEYTLKGRALNQKFDKEANAEAIKCLMQQLKLMIMHFPILESLYPWSSYDTWF